MYATAVKAVLCVANWRVVLAWWCSGSAGAGAGVSSYVRPPGYSVAFSAVKRPLSAAVKPPFSLEREREEAAQLTCCEGVLRVNIRSRLKSTSGRAENTLTTGDSSGG